MHRSKKSLGQNFLFDKNISRKIINLTKVKNKEIIEIGPGLGILTDQIIKNQPKKLTIIEKDKELYNLLLEKYNDLKNIEIINYDALKYNYNKNINSKIIISNLPYNISTKLIFKWLKMQDRFNELILMIQKEVAEKMDYNKTTKKNRLNTFIEISSKFNIEFNVSKNVFYPKPRIESSVIKIYPKKKIKISLEQLEKFTFQIFKNKRKKLKNVLKLKKKINDIDLNKRAEDLTTNQILKIFKIYHIDK